MPRRQLENHFDKWMPLALGWRYSIQDVGEDETESKGRTWPECGCSAHPKANGGELNYFSQAFASPLSGFRSAIAPVTFNS